MHRDAKLSRDARKPARKTDIRIARAGVSAGVVVGEQQGGRLQLKCPGDDRARRDDRVIWRAGNRDLVTQQMVAAVEVEHSHLLAGTIAHHAHEIADQCRVGCRDRSRREPFAQAMLDRGLGCGKRSSRGGPRQSLDGVAGRVEHRAERAEMPDQSAGSLRACAGEGRENPDQDPRARLVSDCRWRFQIPKIRSARIA